jgi:hypothetical protein
VDPEFTKTLYDGDKTRIMQYKATHRECFLIDNIHISQIIFEVLLHPVVVGARRLWPQVDQRVLEAGGMYDICVIDFGSRNANDD